MQTTGFEGRLLKGEKIAWWGQPAQGLMFTSKDWLLVPFSLIFLGFAVSWEVSAWSAPQSSTFMTLLGVPFLLAGLYFFAGRFIVDAWARRGMTYAVTDKRILIARSRPFPKFTAMTFDQLPSVNLIERGNGRGTIRFGPELSIWSHQGSFAAWSPAFDPTPQFFVIEQARQVFERIQTRLAERG
jgi:hypothetical protein